MHRFFQIVENARIEENYVAELVGVHKSTFSRVKTGKRKLTKGFMEGAARALREIGIRQDDGSVYEVRDLFFAHAETSNSTTVNTITKAA